MNTQEAKLILQAYRPGGQDASDPMFAEALELARRDPELQKWLAQEQALDSQVQLRLHKAVPIPFGLKTRLLAQRKTVRPMASWRFPFWLGIAAAVLVVMAVLAGTWISQSGRPQFAELRDMVMRDSIQMEDHVSYEPDNMTSARDWLKTRNAPSDFALPASLHDMVVHGCKVVDWHGRKVSMLCLKNGSNHVDIFVVDCTRFRDYKPSVTPQFGEQNGVETAIWRNGDQTYVMAEKTGGSSLKGIL